MTGEATGAIGNGKAKVTVNFPPPVKKNWKHGETNQPRDTF